MKRRVANTLLAAGTIGLSAIPLLSIRAVGGEEIFAGTDDQASTAIAAIRPGYEPWAAPLWEPPSGEIESLLFGLQAALGAGLVFYCLGYWRGRNSGRNPSSSGGAGA